MLCLVFSPYVPNYMLRGIFFHINFELACFWSVHSCSSKRHYRTSSKESDRLMVTQSQVTHQATHFSAMSPLPHALHSSTSATTLFVHPPSINPELSHNSVVRQGLMAHKFCVMLSICSYCCSSTTCFSFLNIGNPMQRTSSASSSSAACI